MLGLRYDYQTPYVGAMKVAAIDDNGAYNSPSDGFVMDGGAKSAVDTLLPGLELPDMKATAEGGGKYAWKVFSPRIGLTYDITGDGKTLAKLSFGQYLTLGRNILDYRTSTSRCELFVNIRAEISGIYRNSKEPISTYNLLVNKEKC